MSKRREGISLPLLDRIGRLVPVAIGDTEWQNWCLLVPRFYAYIGPLPPSHSYNPHTSFPPRKCPWHFSNTIHTVLELASLFCLYPVQCRHNIPEASILLQPWSGSKAQRCYLLIQKRVVSRRVRTPPPSPSQCVPRVSVLIDPYSGSIA